MNNHHILIIMAGFCRGKFVPASTHIWIDCLASHAKQMVLVFDNSSPENLPEKWKNNDNIEVIFECHGEYDFGSYKRGLACAREKGWLERSTHVLLCNDSVIGPLADLSQVFNVVCGGADHVYGLTMSYQIRPHLQSFFLMMGRDIFLDPAITFFFESIRPRKSRFEVIQDYEIGFSSLLLKAGYKLQSFVPLESCVDPRNGELMGNPMAYPVTMVHLGVPIVKIRALQDANANLNGFSPLARLIAKYNYSLWRTISSDSDYRRIWQNSLLLGLILQSVKLSQLSQWLEWVEMCPHPNCQLILPLSERSISTSARQIWQYRSAIENGKLQILPLQDSDEDLSATELFILASSASACDWLTRADSDLFNHPEKLLVQTHLAAQNPLLNNIPGFPRLFRRYSLMCK